MTEGNEDDFNFFDFISLNSTKHDVFFGTDPGGTAPLIPALQQDYMTKVTTFSALLTSNTRDCSPKEGGFSEKLDERDDVEFFRNLRVTKNTFSLLLDFIKKDYRRVYSGGHYPVEPKVCLQLGLWYLGNRATYRTISQLFGLSESAVFSSVRTVIRIICNLSNTFVKWPTIEEVQDVENQFKKLAGFPGVIGAIDSCHIEIRSPDALKSDFVDQTKKPSVHLMAVCDSQKRFTFIDVGFPGSAQGSEVFEASELYQLMCNSPIALFPAADYHIIGDNTFQLTKHVLVPYRDYGNLSDIIEKYNKKLLQTQVVIENAFEQLKSRFRRLKYVDAVISMVPNIIKACCVIHNIALNNPAEENFLRMERDCETETDEANILKKHDLQFLDASDKRDFIAMAL